MTKNGSYPKIMANDPIVLEQLIVTYSDVLVRYAYLYVGSSAAAEDIMEDAFALLLVKKHSFSSIEQIRSWLYKTVHTRSIDYLRSHKREVPLEDVENVLVSQDVETQVFTKERNKTIYMALRTLPVQYRQVLELSYFDGFSVEQMGAVLSKSSKQIYNLLARAKAALRANLLKEGFSYEEL